MIEKLYTVEEVANLASVTPRTIRNYLKSGKLAGRKIGGQWRFSEDEVQALLAGEDAESFQEVQSHNIAVGQEDMYIEDEEEIYREPFSVSAAGSERNIIEFHPESNYSPEAYEANLPDEFAAQAAPAADQPARLPYTMPVSGKQPGNFGADANGNEPAHHNPAFPHLSAPVQQNPYDIHAQYPNAAMSPFAAQVPGNPQINYYAGQMPAPSMFPAGQQPNMPMYYAPPVSYGAPGMPGAYPATMLAGQPYAQIPGYPPLAYPPQTQPLQAPPQTEDPVAEYKPPSDEKQKKEQMQKKEQAANDSEREFPFELSDIGYQVALFASEVHDCSKGPQVCTIIDLHQSLASAKITSERLMEIADQESELGTDCHCYVEFDTRYYIARYTLFGTSEFLFRCMKLLG